MTLARDLLLWGQRLIEAEHPAALKAARAELYRLGRRCEGPDKCEAGLLYVQAVRGFDGHRGDAARAVTWLAIVGQVAVLLEQEARLNRSAGGGSSPRERARKQSHLRLDAAGRARARRTMTPDQILDNLEKGDGASRALDGHLGRYLFAWTVALEEVDDPRTDGWRIMPGREPLPWFTSSIEAALFAVSLAGFHPVPFLAGVLGAGPAGIPAQRFVERLPRSLCGSLVMHVKQRRSPIVVPPKPGLVI